MSKDQETIQYSIKVDPKDADILLAFLDDLGCVGVTQEDENLLQVFFIEPLDRKALEGLLVKYSASWTSKKLIKVNWNKEWESNFQPIEIGDFCRIYADFHADSDKKFCNQLRINPKMSFGTGHHETTFMMIETMEDLNFESKTVFDFGSGTGILGILASKLGARTVVGNDIEEWAVLNAIENAQNNGVENMTMLQGGLDVVELPGSGFDIILANINRQVLLDSVDKLRQSLSSKGRLIVSGILRQDVPIIEKAYTANGFNKLSQRTKGNWVSIEFD